MGHIIVPCQTILAGRLRPDERRAISAGHTSAQGKRAPADALLMTLSVKPADFARMSNFVWALDHFECEVNKLGMLFLDLEYYLYSPGDRKDLSGDPSAIVEAMDAAFRRGLANLQACARVGLFWQFLQNNFTLDGRFLDLETPLLFGTPFAGLLERGSGDTLRRQPLGFEEFWFVWYWRLFIGWLRSRLRLLSGREVLPDRSARLFLRGILLQMTNRFTRKHLLYSDDALIEGAVDNLAACLDLSRRGRRDLDGLAQSRFRGIVYAGEESTPDLGWTPVPFEVLPHVEERYLVHSPWFLHPQSSAEAEKFAASVRRMEGSRDPKELLLELQGEEAEFDPPPAG